MTSCLPIFPRHLAAFPFSATLVLIEGSVNGVSRDFFRYVNRVHSFFTVHETENLV
ncbi:MAG: hypothetical protein ACI8RD_001546, partial [Bacillariaceae sp.]